MYKLSRVEIDGFWGKHKLATNFNETVNIFIGPNGTGKTTLINLLQAVLLVDLSLLKKLDYNEIRIKLSDGKSVRTVSVKRLQNKSVYDFIKIKISHDIYELPLVPNDLELKRRFKPEYFETLKNLRSRMSSLVYFSWLSVYREMLDEEEELEYRYTPRRRIRILNPIDSRLKYLLSRLRDYLLKLESEANKLSTKFQQQVLISLLYSDQFDTFDLDSSSDVNFQELREQLNDAYKALNVLTSGIRRKIDQHTEIISQSFETVREKLSKKEYLSINDVLPLSLLKRTRKIISLSNETDIKKNELFALLHLFISTTNDFCIFRTIPAGDSGRSRPPIPEQAGHPFN